MFTKHVDQTDCWTVSVYWALLSSVGTLPGAEYDSKLSVLAFRLASDLWVTFWDLEVLVILSAEWKLQAFRKTESAGLVLSRKKRGRCANSKSSRTTDWGDNRGHLLVGAPLGCFLMSTRWPVYQMICSFDRNFQFILNKARYGWCQYSFWQELCSSGRDNAWIDGVSNHWETSHNLPNWSGLQTPTGRRMTSKRCCETGHNLQLFSILPTGLCYSLSTKSNVGRVPQPKRQ